MVTEEEIDIVRPETNQSEHESELQQNVVMIGQGLFGRALESHFKNHAPHYYKFTTCTRSDSNPYEAVCRANFVILVIPASAHSSLMMEIRDKIRPGTIIIDVSNTSIKILGKKGKERSPAICLKKLLPEGVHIVKSFNTLSAQTLMSLRPMFNPISLPYSADSEEAVEKIEKIIRDIGFVGRHWGTTEEAAERIEELPHRVFPGYKWPVITSSIVLFWWIGYTLVSLYIFKDSEGDDLRDWWKAPSSVLMSSTGETSITMFSVTFMAGPIAILAQWWRGNSSRTLWKWLSAWLDNRKELGLVSFYYLIAHTIIGAVSTFHHDYLSSKDWRSSLAPLLGVLSFMLFLVLAICSSESISEQMSWKEFRIVYAFIGTAALLSGTLHHIFWSWAMHKKMPGPAKWALGFMVPTYWLGVIFPVFALTLRFLSWNPVIEYIFKYKNRHFKRKKDVKNSPM